jgi:hypothetical protein
MLKAETAAPFIIHHLASFLPTLNNHQLYLKARYTFIIYYEHVGQKVFSGAMA